MNITVDYLSTFFTPKVADHKRELSLLIKFVKAMELLNDLDTNINENEIDELTLYNDSNIRGLLTEIAFREQIYRNTEKDTEFVYTTEEAVSMVIDSLLDDVSSDTFMYNCEDFEAPIRKGIELANLDFINDAERFVNENIKKIMDIRDETNSSPCFDKHIKELVSKYNKYLHLNIPELTKNIVRLTETYPFQNALNVYAKKHDLPKDYFNEVAVAFQFFANKGTVDSDNIFIINGVGGSGKDTFVQNVFNHADTLNLLRVNYSLVDDVKLAAELLGWDGKKDDEGRKFLAELKDFADNWNNYSVKNCLATIVKDRDILFDDEFLLMFIHARSPKDIRTLVSLMPNIKTILIKRKDYEPEFTNHADNEVYDYDYDEVIINTTLTSLEAISEKFVSKYGLLMN